MLFAQQAYAAAQAIVAWNPDTGQVAGYDVYYGTSSGNYTTTLNAGSNTSATLQNLSAQTYYIALTAYNSSNEQSGYSPELVVDSLTASANYSFCRLHNSRFAGRRNLGRRGNQLHVF